MAFTGRRPVGDGVLKDYGLWAFLMVIPSSFVRLGLGTLVGPGEATLGPFPRVVAARRPATPRDAAPIPTNLVADNAVAVGGRPLPATQGIRPLAAFQVGPTKIVPSRPRRPTVRPSTVARAFPLLGPGVTLHSANLFLGAFRVPLVLLHGRRDGQRPNHAAGGDDTFRHTRPPEDVGQEDLAPREEGDALTGRVT